MGFRKAKIQISKNINQQKKLLWHCSDSLIAAQIFLRIFYQNIEKFFSRNFQQIKQFPPVACLFDRE